MSLYDFSTPAHAKSSSDKVVSIVTTVSEDVRMATDLQATEVTGTLTDELSSSSGTLTNELSSSSGTHESGVTSFESPSSTSTSKSLMPTTVGGNSSDLRAIMDYVKRHILVVSLAALSELILILVFLFRRIVFGRYRRRQ
jgi:hypothetical protein